MIPHIIHYFWQSEKPMPEKLQRCIESWHKYCPDFEFKCWNGDSLGENTPIWVKQALEHKKYAFAADYMRYYALHNYGGIYMDTDVELLQPFGDLLDAPYLMGHETHGNMVESGFLAVEKGHPFVAAMLDYYNGREFVKPDGTLDMRGLPATFKEVAAERGFRWVDVERPSEIEAHPHNLYILPADYFSPISLQTYAMVNLTGRTVTIHHFVASWKSGKYHWKRRLQRLLGHRITLIIIRIKDRVLRRAPK